MPNGVSSRSTGPFAAFPKGSNANSNEALFYPYTSRTRLFRTVNDVYMLINSRQFSSSDVGENSKTAYSTEKA